MSESQSRAKRAPRKYDQKVLRAVCLIGFVATLAMAAYTILASLPIGRNLLIGPARLSDTKLDFLLAFAFVLVGAFGLLANYRKRSDVILLLALHYFALVIFAILVAGNQEFTDILWMILLATTGLAVGWWCMIGGGATMLAASLLAQFWPGPTPSTAVIFDDIILLIIIFAVAALVVWLRQIGVIQTDAYENLKIRERLSEQRLETIINSVTDAVLSVGRDGKINFYNAATLSLVDTNKSLSGRFLDEFFHLVDSDNKPVKFANILLNVPRTTTRDDLCHVYTDGQKINLMIEISPVREVFHGGNVSADAGLILVLRDITKQKSLDDQRDEFISVVSHELRTPVAIAEGALSNLQFLLTKNADPKTFGPNLDSAHDEILYLGKMVNDLSTLSRAQRGVMMDPEVIDVREFADALYQKYLPEATKDKLTLDLDLHVGGEIHVSRMAIEEIMQNLITNALKYTRQGGVTIIANFAKKAGKIDKNRIEFAVRDTGIGISISDQKHVFERFWRSEDYRTRETGGTGLGLNIVQQLADKIGVKIEFKSRLNHGSTFSFTLPLFAKSPEKKPTQK